MNKRALVVGINNYDNMPALSCCVDDARAMADVLSRHADRSPNYDCLTLTSDKAPVTEDALRAKISQLFADFRGGDVVFYFSGHGVTSDDGGYLATQDAKEGDQGFPMVELLEQANESGIGTVLMILDCCHSGDLGNTGGEEGQRQATIAEGVTILAASTALQESQEGMEHSLFTGLLLEAIRGGAANLRGEVTAAGVYGYVEQVFGSWQQRPMYKSHARHLKPIRQCEASVDDETLRSLPELFRLPFSKVQLDKSFEFTEDEAVPENVSKFNSFKSLRDGSLLTTEDGDDLYFVAMKSKSVFLTPLGQLYWQLAKNGRI